MGLNINSPFEPPLPPLFPNWESDDDLFIRGPDEDDEFRDKG
jgi:hypothetical protein